MTRYLTEYQWIYYFGPVLGAVIGSASYILYEYYIEGKHKEEKGNKKKPEYQSVVKFDIEMKKADKEEG